MSTQTLVKYDVPAVHALLLAKAAEINWPEAYRNDLLVHDLNCLTKYEPPRFLWILRECGTEFIYLAEGYCAKNRSTTLTWARYWLGGKSGCSPCRVFTCDSQALTLREVTHQRALDLFAEWWPARQARPDTPADRLTPFDFRCSQAPCCLE